MTENVRAGVVGWPIEHSRSPLVHRHWLRQYGIAGQYDRFAVEPEGFEAFVRNAGHCGLAGFNVTVPHKVRAFELADEKDASAKEVGAANTIWYDGTRICASNTDTYGFMTHLTQSVPDWRIENAPVVVIGAGGAARAVIHGFIEAGVEEIIVCNRTQARAEQLARSFEQHVRIARLTEVGDFLDRTCVLVNTTSLGMTGQPRLEVDLSSAHGGLVVSDIVYSPLETLLLRSARERGLRTVDGLGMLLHQAVPGFEKWFGVRPRVDDVLRALIIADLEQA